MLDKHRKKDIEYLFGRFDSLTQERNYEKPSEYIQKNRIIPRGLSPKPGYYDYSYTPYLREIIDNLDASSPVRKIAVMKSAQIGATVGLIESGIMYHIGCDPLPQVFVTADKELAKKTMTTRIEPMLEYSKLDKLIKAQHGRHRTGSTNLSKEYRSGHLHLLGANNPDGFRGVTYPRMYLDEIDTYSRNLKNEGNAIALAENRTLAFAATRKIIYASTPLTKQTSQIYYLFMQGDQRYFNVPCPHCAEFQALVWHGKDDNGREYGMHWESNKKFMPIDETIGYICRHCQEKFYNYHKAEMLDKGKWIATATANEPGLVSYHINALYSPVGMYSFTNMVYEWIKCWDMEKNKLKDLEQYRSFRNTKQGLPFEERGESIRMEKVKANRSYYYSKNTINNYQFKKDTGSELLLLTCSVDVQKVCLYVDVKGWTAGGRSYTIDFFSIDGPTEDYNSPVWKELEEILCDRVWLDENDRKYKIITTVIDSGKFTTYVYNFCKKFTYGVQAIKGNDHINGGLTYKEFAKTTLEKAGLSVAYHVNSTRMKDFIARMFNLNWDTGEFQPEWYANFPEDMRDDYFRQFEAEHKVDEYDKITNKFLRTRWKLTPGRENHALDTFAYNLACLEIEADYVCRNELGLTLLDWPAFWKYASKGVYYA